MSDNIQIQTGLVCIHPRELQRLTGLLEAERSKSAGLEKELADLRVTLAETQAAFSPFEAELEEGRRIQEILDNPPAASEKLKAAAQRYQDRAAEKQASRDEDARRLAAGEVTREQLNKENSFLPLERMGEIDYSKVPRVK